MGEVLSFISLDRRKEKNRQPRRETDTVAETSRQKKDRQRKKGSGYFFIFGQK